MSNPINAITFKQGKVVAITYDAPGTTGALRTYDPATDTWTILPMTPGALPIDRPGSSASVGTRFVSANKALYFQSRYGLTKIEDIASGVCRSAIQPKAIVSSRNTDAFTTDTITNIVPTNTLVSNPWLLNTNQTAYRITIARFGANKELIESEPSERFLTANTLGAPAATQFQSLRASWMIPPEAFFRVWRSVKQSAPGIDPFDEMFLVMETKLPTTIDANGFLTVATTGSQQPKDQNSDSWNIVPLYTNAQTGGTIAASNTPAPLAMDMAWFKNRMYYLNTTDVQRLTVRVTGTGSGGIANNDTVTVVDKTLYFRATPTSPVVDIALSTAGTPSQNIDTTASSAAVVMAKAFFPDNDPKPLWSKVVAHYPPTTTISDIGQIQLQSLLPGVPAFIFKTGSPLGWDKDYSGGTESDPNTQAAGLQWSNPGQPEGVPLANTTVLGDPTAAGQRLIALKEALFIFKQDGLWKVVDDGVTAPSVQLLDPTVRLAAGETAVALDNFIIALCDQGVVLVSETGGVINISHNQIERDLLKLMATVGSDTLQKLAFAVANQPEHTYILALPESKNASACTKQFVYNLQTQTWTSWNISGVLCGAVSPDTGQLFWGRSDGTIWIERKNYDSTDHQDPGFQIACPASTATATLTFTGDLRSGPTPFAVGDVVQQPQATQFLQQRVTSVSYASGTNQTTVTLDAVPKTAWSNTQNLVVLKAVQVRAKFLPIYDQQPLVAKDWGDTYLSFRYCDHDFLQIVWQADGTPYTATQNATEPIASTQLTANGTPGPITVGAWGPEPWGEAVWGRKTRDVLLKATIPQEFARSAQLTPMLIFANALCRFELSAWDFKINGSTPKAVR